MIKVSELRIGNWVNFCGSQKQIEGISIRHRPDCGYFQLSDIEIWQKGIHLSPIFITEEWLLRVGAKDIGRVISHIGFNLNDLIIRLHSPNVLVDLGQFDVEVKYVHELQNLIFALTGKELILKP